ncbi:thioesterase II family protein [Bailinhaonella thermotolerans]|uniref:Thioesterase n=1 Tax=Bailinhaonella thermotolerans TaxID=1070861 RepID=A0A3A4A0Y5_9ACTN|nr:alpha/beta fold hydrolase [Bailinhaonella thermotolerans]RJL20550.1 thioesterase [Bailinhaonella thermotolerans]
MSWLRCGENRPWAARRLVCFPHAGGSAAFYRAWSRALPSVEVHAVQYPGRADRIAEPYVEDVARMARHVVQAVAPLLDRPLALFGHSMGALVAYETARLLEDRGAVPAHLFVSGARPAHDPDRVDEAVAGRDDDGFVAALLALGGSDAELLADPDMRELVLPYVRSDFRAVESYRHRPGPPLAAPVTALIGAEDPKVDAARAEGWRDLTRGGFALRALPGDHFYLVPSQELVMEEIRARLGVPAATGGG